MQALLGVAGAGTVLAVAGLALRLPRMAMIIFLLALVILLLMILGSYLVFRSWQRKMQSAQFTGDLTQHTSASPRSISDPGQRARLDELRKKFGEGIDAYRSRGKDIYKLPWYAIVGEPGAGKTEAIRHCNIGFPPGMQDCLQGVGGTINMNWWFANNAVLLDTAGRLMFEDVKPGETSEWREFLNLLRKNRPNCPVNGLFLVIPADSLITDTADAIEKKAGRIAQQLDIIQRVLDIRFPVFVIITKCDKITGFKEFFDGVTDPNLQHQILGWSNPNPLDEPFQAELVDEHLAHVVERLRLRRMALLRDVVPEDPATRRADEVDALYAFPHSMELIGARLRNYLKTIFVSGEWSAKPLFFRGIYFSSSMREGSALDQDLAKVLGVPPDALPEGKNWERERAYFLRDMFVEKAFKERGLVTRATNTRKMLRRRQAALFSFGFAALATFIVVTWFAIAGFNNLVGKKSAIWKEISDVGWTDSTWNQAIIGPAGAYRPTVKFNDGATNSQGAFYSNLLWEVEHPLKKDWKIPGLASKYNEQSTNMARIVFETGVIKPLIDAVRYKLTNSAEIDERQSAALTALMNLEGDIRNRPSSKLDEAGAARFLGTYLTYLSNNYTVDTNIAAAMAWTYSNHGPAQSGWPPAWLSEAGPTASTNSTDYPVLLRGLANFITHATGQIHSQVEIWNMTTSLQSALDQFKSSEKTLIDDAQAQNSEAANKDVSNLAAAKDLLDRQTNDIAKSPLWKGTLTETYQNLRTQVQKTGKDTFDSVRNAANKLAADHPDMPIFADISNKLVSTQRSIDAELEKLKASADPNKLTEYDRNYFGDNALYAQRWAVYDRAWKLSPPAFTPKWGSLSDDLQNYSDTELKPVLDQISGYTGPLFAQAGMVGSNFVGWAQSREHAAVLETYLGKASSELDGDLGFPLTRNQKQFLTLAQVKAVSEKIKAMTRDANRLLALTNDLTGADIKWAEKCRLHVARLRGVKAVLDALFDDQDQPVAFQVFLPAGGKDQWWRGAYRYVDIGQAGQGQLPLTDGKDKSLGSFQVTDPINIIFNTYTTPPQTATVPSTNWEALYLHLYYGKTVEGKSDQPTWRTELQTVIEGKDALIPLDIKSSALPKFPALEDWPKF